MGKIIFMLIKDVDDRSITQNTLRELGHDVPTRFFSDSTGLFAALIEQVPSLVLVDYNSRPDPGPAILKRLKSDDRYRAIPVVILTDSPIWHFHEQCYREGASTVIKKPDSGLMTTQKIRICFDYWLNVAETI